MKKLILIMLLFGAWGCQSKDPDPLIVGDWLWKESRGGFAGHSVKPNPKDRFVLRIGRQGTFESFRNDTLEMSGSYTIEKSANTYNGKETSSIRVLNRTVKPSVSGRGIGPYFMGFTNDILILDRKNLTLTDNFMDGYESRFERVK
ncbi:hypothetical protein [Rudanella lutea]|uniref:hypothetical protein n=1 Tax=Rudanella lutea TaxID=451374 RepID=UPI0012FAEAB0|nr:hypothetical protein [Rudanella lutea]